MTGTVQFAVPIGILEPVRREIAVSDHRSCHFCKRSDATTTVPASHLQTHERSSLNRSGPLHISHPHASPPDHLTSLPPPPEFDTSTLALRRVPPPTASGEHAGLWSSHPCPRFTGRGPAASRRRTDGSGRAASARLAPILHRISRLGRSLTLLFRTSLWPPGTVGCPPPRCKADAASVSQGSRTNHQKIHIPLPFSSRFAFRSGLILRFL